MRCLGEVTRERLDTLREADAIVVSEIKAADLYRSTSQAFAVLLPVQSRRRDGRRPHLRRRARRPLRRRPTTS